MVDGQLSAFWREATTELEDEEVRHVSDEERRARLAVRHALAPAYRAKSPEAVAQAMTVLHATEPATVYLSYWTRSRSPDKAHLDYALYEGRSLVKQLAMRRTLFVFPRDLLAAAWGSAAARVAGAEERRLTKEIVKARLAANGERWLKKVCVQLLSVLAEHPMALSGLELRKVLPKTGLNVNISAGKPGTTTQVLTYLSARGDIVRATNRGQWYTAQPRWTLMRHWLDNVPKASKPADGYRELVFRWLRTFGPGMEGDIVWWLGATKSVVRTALAELSAVEVSFDDGTRGWLLPDDLEEVPQPEPWVALLPSLDPTVMGWRSRGFYAQHHQEKLFDSQGNAGTTVWVDGRIVGYWVQDSVGALQLRLLEKVSTQARRELESEARRLAEWLAGIRLFTVLHNRE